MYIIDGIAYASESVSDLKISGVRPRNGLMLWVRFNTGETRLLDCSPLVDSAALSTAPQTVRCERRIDLQNLPGREPIGKTRRTGTAIHN